MKNITPFLTLVCGVAVIGIAGVHHLAAAPDRSNIEFTIDADADTQLEELQRMLRENKVQREAAEDERLVLGVDAGPLASEQERALAAERWHGRLDEARRASLNKAMLPVAPKATPRVREITKVKTVYRKNAKTARGQSMFERSRGYSLHGSAYPLRRLGGRSRRYSSIYNRNRYR